MATACSTGTRANPRWGAFLIALEDAEVMVAGGRGSAINRIGIAGGSPAAPCRQALTTGEADVAPL